MSLLDFVFPKRCVVCKKQGSYLCESCFSKLSFDAKSSCLVCGNPSYDNLTHLVCKKKYSIDGCFSAISYNFTTQKLIYNFKYKPYISDLSKTLCELFYESIIQNENFIKNITKEKFVIVPIPLFSKKQKNRGYNQSEILGIALSKKLKIPAKNILFKIKETKAKHNLSNTQRSFNLRNAFKTKENIRGQNVLLIDDIVITGATLKEATKALKKAGASKVFGLTLARD